jgi:hypothetical protein
LPGPHRRHYVNISNHFVFLFFFLFFFYSPHSPANILYHFLSLTYYVYSPFSYWSLASSRHDFYISRFFVGHFRSISDHTSPFFYNDIFYLYSR